MKRCRHRNSGNNRIVMGIKHKSKGFTLVELAVTVAISAIMISLAVPAVTSYMTRHAPRYAADELFGDIQLARMRAANNNQPCRIVFNSPEDNQYTIEDISNAGALLGTFKVGNLDKFRDRITFTDSPDPTDNSPFTELQFLPQGVLDLPNVVPAGSNSVFLTNEANDVFYRVLVSAAGGSSVDRWVSSIDQWR